MVYIDLPGKWPLSGTCVRERKQSRNKLFLPAACRKCSSFSAVFPTGPLRLSAALRQFFPAFPDASCALDSSAISCRKLKTMSTPTDTVCFVNVPLSQWLYTFELGQPLYTSVSALLCNLATTQCVQYTAVHQSALCLHSALPNHLNFLSFIFVTRNDNHFWS